LGRNIPFSDGKLYLQSIDLHKSRGLSFVDNGIMGWARNVMSYDVRHNTSKEI
jgi:hypothetical protein